MKRIDVEARADVLLDQSDFAGLRGLLRGAAYHVPAEFLNAPFGMDEALGRQFDPLAPECDRGIGCLTRRMRNARYHLSQIGGDPRPRILELGDDATGRADVWAHLGETFAVASVSDGHDRAATMMQSRNLALGLQKTDADVFVLRAGANDLLGHGRLARVLSEIDPDTGVAIDAPALVRAIREVISDCRAILASARFERPDVAMILRGYPLPICTPKSRWLAVPFRTLRIDQSAANATVRMIIVSLNSALATLAAKIPGCTFVAPEDAVLQSMKHAFDPLVTGRGVEHLALRDALMAPPHAALRSSRSTPLQRFARIDPLGFSLVSDELDKGMGF